jgi:hypothetical protein
VKSKSDADTTGAETTVGTSKAKHRKDVSIKDRVTRALTRVAHAKQAKAEKAKDAT